MPYSLTACEDAVNKLGLQKGGKGYSFTASSYSTKGCFAYASGTFANIAFYGLGGSEEENKIAPVNSPNKSPKYRPSGYDCSTPGNIQ